MGKTLLFKETYWACAYRYRQPGSFLDVDDHTPFKTIKCKRNQWAADPFLFSENGTDIYMFVELTNTKKSKAVIGVKKIYPTEEKDFKCAIELNGHVSYPCIFKENGKIYMIPETGFRKTLELFECVEFPLKWKNIAVLKDGIVLGDCTPFSLNDKKYIFLFELLDNTKEKNLYIAKLDLKKRQLQDEKLVEHYKDSDGRPGGHVINDGIKMLRVVQPSTNFYGEKIELREFTLVNGKYNEKTVKTVTLDDLYIEDNQKYLGLHTYNSYNNVEVIDLLKHRFSLFKPIKVILKKLRLFGYGLYDKTGDMLYEKR